MRSKSNVAHRQVHLLSTFQVEGTCDDSAIGQMGAKVVTFVAVHEQPVDRGLVAGTLWPHVSDTRASANLRTTLWRVSGAAPSLLDIDGHTLGLFSSTRVDFREAVALARRILERQCDVATISNREITLHVVPQLTTELTPNWYDEWLLVHQERWRQLRLHALDALAERLIEDGRCALAIDAATAAVDSEPLRESGYRCLIQAHLAQGNISEAIRTYRAYCELLMLELGVLPSPMMNDLLASFSFP